MEDNPFLIDKPLDFVSDDILQDLINKLIDRVSNTAAKKDKTIYKNVIDPFSALIDSYRQNITLDEWLELEKVRQIQKTLQNYIGDFHQDVIGSIKGWDNLKVGKSLDLRNSDKKIIAEVKNKHNTMNSSSALAIYDKLKNHLDYGDAYDGFTAYCVVIIPKNPKPLNNIFSPSERGTPRPKREDLRIIDGKSFYQIATGDVNALQNLYIRVAFLLAKKRGIPLKEYTKNNDIRDFFIRAYTQR